MQLPIRTGSGWNSMVDFMHQLLYSLGNKPSYPNNGRLGGPQKNHGPAR
jgi:hypothetical protein